MELREYQQQACQTEKRVHAVGSDIAVPILGLAGEVGELINEYKKYLRDGDAHERFPERVAEELGDILWYVAQTATKFDLDLTPGRPSEPAQDPSALGSHTGSRAPL